jgi:membrane-associated protease RseP (regulator of RpoE activity)
MSWEPHVVVGAAIGLVGEELGLVSPPEERANVRRAPTGAELAMDIRQTILRYAGQGFTYMVCVIAILFAHEMGHYVATRIYKIPSTPPFFIPFPIAPIGTMGAVIAMKGQQADRREIFDIGIAGPLAGLVFAIPILWVGVGQMEPVAPSFGTYKYDLPLLVRWMYSVRHPAAPMLTEVTANQVNAMFMAGWVGLLITGLNMMPVSQLDGGHVTYTLFGRYSRWIARAFVGVALTYMILNRVYIWMLMLALVFLIGLYHPPTSDDSVPLGKWRIGLGLASLLIPILCFPPRGLMP